MIKITTKNKLLARNKYMELKVHFNNILMKSLLQ
jgi:hypothetical protein